MAAVLPRLAALIPDLVVRPCYIGVDLGTSGCRAVAINQARNIVAEERTDLPEPVRDAAGWVAGCPHPRPARADQPIGPPLSPGPCAWTGPPLPSGPGTLALHQAGQLPQHTLVLGGASNSGGAVLRRYFDEGEIQRLSATLDPDLLTGLDYYPLPAPSECFPTNDSALQPRLSPRPADDRRFFQGLLKGIRPHRGSRLSPPAHAGCPPAEIGADHRRGRDKCRLDRDQRDA